MASRDPSSQPRVVRNLGQPDERIEASLVSSSLVSVGGMTIGRDVHEPGWRWSTHIRTIVGTEWCQVRHLGVVLSGRLRVALESGEEFELRPWDIIDIAAHHDAWVVGDEPAVTLEWRGARAWLEPLSTMAERALATILFTDIVDSTAIAERLGGRAWGDLLATHDEIVRSAVERFHGHVVKSTGDGVLATFDSPARAIRCSVALRADLQVEGLTVRAAITTGEIDVADEDIRGVAIHEASRMLGIAEAGEIVVGDVTRSLARDVGTDLADRGETTFRGLGGRYRLWSIPPP